MNNIVETAPLVFRHTLHNQLACVSLGVVDVSSGIAVV